MVMANTHSWHQCAGQRRFARQFRVYSMNAPDIKALFSSVRTGTPVKWSTNRWNIPWNRTGCVMLKTSTTIGRRTAERSDNAIHTAAGFTQFKDNKGVDQKLVDKGCIVGQGIRFRWAVEQLPQPQCAFSRVSAEWWTRAREYVTATQ